MHGAAILSEDELHIVLLVTLNDGRCFVVSSDKATPNASMVETCTGNVPGLAVATKGVTT